VRVSSAEALIEADYPSVHLALCMLTASTALRHSAHCVITGCRIDGQYVKVETHRHMLTHICTWSRTTPGPASSQGTDGADARPSKCAIRGRDAGEPDVGAGRRPTRRCRRSPSWVRTAGLSVSSRPSRRKTAYASVMRLRIWSGMSQAIKL